jgi:uncharacterized repeat protein (TIGR01451 family)
MALLGNLWKRFRSSPLMKKQARRLFMEPLESRELLAAILSISQVDNFSSPPPDGTGQPVPAGTQNLIYTIRVVNTGDADSTNIDVFDAQPDHTSNGSMTVAASPADSGATVAQQPGPSDNRANGKIAVLHPGGEVDFSFQVAVDSNADLDSVNPQHEIVNVVSVNDDAFDTVLPQSPIELHTPTTTVADFSITKEAAPTPSVNAGDQITYTIRVENSGPSDSRPVGAGVQMIDAVPAGTTLVSFNVVSYTGPGGTAAWTSIANGFADTSSVPTGAMATFQMVVQVPASAPDGTVTNTASLMNQGLAGDTNNLNDTAMVSTTVVGAQAPDILVTKTGPADPVISGQDIQYTIIVKNQGNLPASGVVLKDNTPANTTFASMSPVTGWAISPPAGGMGLIQATPDHPLAPGETATFTLIVHTNPAVTSGTKIDNTASVDPVNGELNTGNNSQTAENTFESDADITITKDDGVTSLNAGDMVTYTITVTNTGPSAVIATSEVQAVTVTGTTGTFTLTFNGQTTNPLAFNATAAQVQTELNNLSSIGPTGSVAVTQSGSTYTITFGGSLANQNVAQLTASGSGGATATASTVMNGSGFVTIADTFPADLTGVTFTSTPANGATGNTATGSGNINDNVNMPSGSSITYTVKGTVNPATNSTQLINTATATVPSGVVDANPSNNTATDTDDITKSVDVSLSIADDHDPANPNQDLVYTYTVTNSGPSSSGPVTFQTTVPTDTTFVSFDLTGAPGWLADPGNPASGAAAGSPVAAMVTDMAPGATALIKMTVHISASININTTITNNANITNGIDITPANNSDTETTQVVSPNPDIVVTKNGPATVVAGNTITYTITIANNGFVSANSVVLTDTIPTNTSYVSFTQLSGPDNFVIPNGQPVNGAARATIASLPNGHTDTFRLVVRVNPGDTAAITNSAVGSIANNQTDLNPGDNTSQPVTTTVTTQSDVSVTKSDSPDPIIVGSKLTYTITVNNSGPSNAANVVLTDVLPANTTFFSMSQPAGWTVPPPAGGVVTATRSSLAPSSPTTFTLIVTVNGNTPNNTDISNTVIVAADNDTNAANNSATTHTTALAQLDFGDAPASYGTLFADDGARHVILNNLHMGASVDFEINGQPNATATGDDTNGIDDEDGVTLPGLFIAGRNAAVIVNASAAGKLDAWIDFDRNGKFDPTDRIASSIDMLPGNNTIHFSVPASASTGATFARFRISTAGGLGPTGGAADGEVEDYATSIITVQPGTVAVLPNPEAPGQNQLSIEGTAGNDTITVTQLRSFHLLLQVVMNGHNMGSFSMGNYRSIVVYAGAGDDTVNIKPGMQSFVHGEDGNDRLTTAGGFDELFGDAGNDTLNSGGGDDYLEGDDGNDSLIAGSGNDVLLGGAGNDSLSGGAGRDILIGGLGADRLSGDAGDDILIGGTTVHDNNRNAINQIMATWVSNRDQFATRVAKLGPLLNAGTVMDDGAVDRLDGGKDKDHDWFIDFLAADQIVNFSSKYDRKN